MTSGTGRVIWEFLQSTGHRLIFDTQDILATVIGVCAAALLFQAITPNTIDEPGQSE
jgi:hypothetical protein